MNERWSGHGGSAAWRRTLPAAWILLALAVTGCGLKAPPVPREVVVPAPVQDLEVRPSPGGTRIRFTLPSKSLDGSSLDEIGGYRILRKGPRGKEAVRSEVRFSVTARRRKVGKRVEFLDAPPPEGGRYRYCVVPLDAYGSHASRRRIDRSCWVGFLGAPPPTEP